MVFALSDIVTKADAATDAALEACAAIVAASLPVVAFFALDASLAICVAKLSADAKADTAPDSAERASDLVTALSAATDANDVVSAAFCSIKKADCIIFCNAANESALEIFPAAFEAVSYAVFAASNIDLAVDA